MKKGDNFTWNDSVAVQVIRVAKDGSWADIFCQEFGDGGIEGVWMGSCWTKRQSLPFPGSFIPQEKNE